VKKSGDSFFTNIGKRFKNFGENTWDVTKTFFKSLGRSIKEMWNGNPAHTGYMKHAGKGLLLFATILTSVLTANTIIRAKNMAKNLNAKTIDKTKESMVI
jgi:hypothetical protein